MFTCSYRDLERLIDYVKNQQEHQKKQTFEQEYRWLIEEAGLKIDERFFPDKFSSFRAEVMIVTMTPGFTGGY